MKIGISNFARQRHIAGSGRTYYRFDESILLHEIEQNWHRRTPGMGRTDLEKVVIVPMNPANFVGTSVFLIDNLPLKAVVERRQPLEDPYVSVFSTAEPELVNFAKIVLYSAEALLENDGSRSGDYDFEVVAMIASAVENEPMTPLTMARNFLEKSGGTKCDYTAQQFAEAIYYWSQRVKHI